MNNKNIVIIGGGHGQAMICSSIKNISNININAIVTVADDGGSTGRLRELFHLPAMGDIRNVLLALSDSDDILVKLMNYRFSNYTNDQTDVLGHNLGNLIFTALANETGSFDKSIEVLRSMLHIKGHVLPVTDQIVTLNALMKDGTRVKGEKNIPTMENQIAKVFYDVPVYANDNVINAIKQADLIIYGIGSLYTSILPNVIISDINEALKISKAPKVYFCNAMTQPGETDGYSVEDHVNALFAHHVPVDLVICCNDIIPENILDKYLKQHSKQVYLQEKQHQYQIMESSLLSFEHDLVRHDPNKILKVFLELLERID